MSVENLHIRNQERMMKGLGRTERHGLVTSYDPKKHLAKVTFQPSGEESGWLPIEEGHVGNGWGHVVGLTAGTGKGNQNQGGGGGGGGGGGSSGGGSSGGGSSGGQEYQGDQVCVRFHEGDLSSGKIVRRVHSKVDTPPKVESGEMLFMHSLGSRFFLKKDGSMHIYGKTSKQDDQGQQQQSGSAGDEGLAGAGAGGGGGGSSASGGGGGGGTMPPLKNAPPLEPQTYKIKIDPKGVTTISHYQQKQSGSGSSGASGGSGNQDPSDPTSTKSPAYYSTMVTDPTSGKLSHTHTTYHKDEGGGDSSSSGGGGKATAATSQGDPGKDSSNEKQAKMFSQTVHNSTKKQMHHTTYDDQGKKKHQVIMDNQANKLTVQTFEEGGEHPQHQMIMDQSSGRMTMQTNAGGQQMAQITMDKSGNINKKAKGKLTIHAQGGIESNGAWKHSGGYTGDVVNAQSMTAAAGSVPGPTPGTPGGQAGTVGAPSFQSGGSASSTSSSGSGSSPQQG